MDLNTPKLRATRPNTDQKLHMLQFLEDHVELANDKYSSSIDGAHERSRQWNTLAIQLNALNGAKKTGEKWRKYWQDQRSYVKERNATINASRCKTGVHTLIKELSEYENRVTALISVQAIVGDMEVHEFGPIALLDVSLPNHNTRPVAASFVSMSEEAIPELDLTNHFNQQDVSVSLLALPAYTAEQRPNPIVLAETPNAFQTIRGPVSSRKRIRSANRMDEDEQFNKYLLIEEKKLAFEKDYKERKLNLMEKIAHKTHELEEAKIIAINDLKDAIKNLNK